MTNYRSFMTPEDATVIGAALIHLPMGVSSTFTRDGVYHFEYNVPGQPLIIMHGANDCLWIEFPTISGFLNYFT